MREGVVLVHCSFSLFVFEHTNKPAVGDLRATDMLRFWDFAFWVLDEILNNRVRDRFIFCLAEL